MKNTHPLISLVLMVLMAVACSSPISGNENTPQTATTPESGSQSQTPEVQTPTVVPTEVHGKPFISAPGLANIKLLTGVQGAGGKPLFIWEAITDANRYQLIVFDEAGEPYWGWEGTKTQVYMGGMDAQPPADSSGPSIDAGYTWVVVAYGSGGKVLAASEVRPISP
ncbi:MAG TPA: hypothetical protein VK206_07600 [Anaerolineales bacterium]|nr:hypothetical protein [Anaerolineales bacterium]